MGTGLPYAMANLLPWKHIFESLFRVSILYSHHYVLLWQFSPERMLVFLREASVLAIKLRTVNPLLLLYIFGKNKRVKKQELKTEQSY